MFIKNLLFAMAQVFSSLIRPENNLGGRFGYFFFFSAREGERGSPKCQERGGGGWLFIENSRMGDVSRWRRGREGVCGESGIFFWGVEGLNIFYRGRNVHP